MTADSARTPTTLRTSMPALLAGMAALALAVAAGFAVSALQPDAGLNPGPPPPPPTTNAPEPSASPSPTASPASTPRPTPRPSPTASPTATPLPTPAPPVATPVVTPTPSPNTGNVLPPCAYMDVPTMHAGLDEWPITLLDTIYMLPAGYAPPDLVDSSTAGLNDGYALRRLLIEDLRAMADDARAAGAPIQLVSGYRSHAQQQATFDHWVSVGGYDQALRTSARAGHSEHQLGTVIDVTGVGDGAPWEHADWATTPAGAWMAANAWRYGFVMSYPRGAADRTCYDYEPWHYRYVGRDLAAEIVASGLTPREVIWKLQ